MNELLFVNEQTDKYVDPQEVNIWIIFYRNRCCSSILEMEQIVGNSRSKLNTKKTPRRTPMVTTRETIQNSPESRNIGDGRI